MALVAWALLRAADQWWPATLLMFGPRWVLALPLALLLPAAAVWRRRSLGPLLLGFLLIVGPVMGFNVPWQRLTSASLEGPRLRVLTCNMHYQAGDPGPLDRLLTETRPDVIALQEWRSLGRASMLDEGGWHVHRAQGLFLGSRYSILRATAVGDDSMGETGLAMRYELETPTGVVTLFSLHLASPRGGLEDAVHDRGRAAAALGAGSVRRAEQSEYLAREAATVTGPVLLAGDFNTPPESILFRRVWGDYTDAFSAAGWGWGYTFLSRRAAVRIDHVLVGPGWRCERCWAGPDIGSPHRPVLADLTWSP
jgi:endonuclease/exonuclease/phosphatase (EEP) superfamily protein YafD